MAAVPATLADIFTMLNDPTLNQKVSAACIRTAVSVAFEDPGTANHVGRLAWAKSALTDPTGTAVRVLRYVVAAVVANNPAFSLAELEALSDATIQANVDASLVVFAA